MDPTVFALSIVVLLFSVILHEVMHGFAALKFGDHTAERAGRLTLNPLPHIDPIGTLLLPLLLIISHSPVIIGWAKPVPVNPFNFRDIRKGELVTSAAGVLANLGLAITAAIVFHLIAPLSAPGARQLFAYAAYINIALATFNSLPIPPLDGSKILASFLPPSLAAQYKQLERYGVFILMFLLFIPFGNTTLVGLILSLMLSLFHAISGVPFPSLFG